MKIKVLFFIVIIYSAILFFCLTNNSTRIAFAQSDSCTDGQSLVIDTVNKRYKCLTISSGGLGSGGNVNMTVANASSTGTTTNRLAKLTGAPSTALITSTSDTENAIGVCISGCGTTGSATIAILGQVNCDFDNATVAGDYVIISTTTTGKCHDNGATFPNAAAAYGRVLTTNGSSGTYSMELMTPDIAFQNAGNGKSRPASPTTSIQYNNSGSFGGSSQLLWDSSTWQLIIGASGGCCAGNILLKEQSGRTFAVAWNGFGWTLLSSGDEIDIGSGTPVYMNQKWRFETGGNLIPYASDGGYDVGDSTHHIRSLYFTNLIGNSNKRVYSGSTPSIAGNATLNSGSKDSAGKITSTGTGASTAVITFGTAFNNAPACLVTNETTANLVRPVSTTTTLTINATVVTSDSISYICVGY